jgi:hypothetical protein
MSEPFAVNGQDIVVLVPSILEPSIRNLAGRLRDMEPILERIYGKPYKIVVHNAEDVS